MFFVRGAEALVQQAREWESSAEYARAVECFLKVTPNVTSDISVLEKCWAKVRIQRSKCSFPNCMYHGTSLRPFFIVIEP